MQSSLHRGNKSLSDPSNSDRKISQSHKPDNDRFQRSRRAVFGCLKVTSALRRFSWFAGCARCLPAGPLTLAVRKHRFGADQVPNRERQRAVVRTECAAARASDDVVIVISQGGQPEESRVLSRCELPGLVLTATAGSCQRLSMEHDPNGLTFALPNYAAAQTRSSANLLPAVTARRHRGGVQIEWHARGIDFEIEVQPSGEVRFSYENSLAGGDIQSVLTLNDYSKLYSLVRSLHLPN